MAQPITIPRLGWNMEQGVFVGWLKTDGSAVRAGEPLFTLESEKATEEVEGLDDGILHIPADGPRQGDVIPVGNVIGYVLQPGEPIPLARAPAAAPHQAEPAHGDPLGALTQPRSAETTHHRRLASSPRARRSAARLGVDWQAATGTGRSGRIRERDVLALAARLTDGQPAAAGSGTRRIIAERMLTSHLSTAPVTLTTTIDVTELVKLRERLKTSAARSGAIVPSFTDLFTLLSALSLQQHPGLNARLDNERVVLSDRIHIGIAVDTDAGLVVPVVRDVPLLGLQDLAVRTRDLIERAREHRLSSSELQGGTFTVTSLGSLGIDAFTPIINYPECAILGIGRIRRCPAVVDDQITIRDQVTLSLTFDHRITDGAPAARFLQSLSAAVADPEVHCEM